MTIAIITPLHRDNWFIADAYRSLLRQTDPDWRWYILLNGEGSISKHLPNHDERIVVWRTISRGIGYLKRELCMVCEEDRIVELDYDDLLEPMALEEINDAFDLGADFVYSDFAEFRDQTIWEGHIVYRIAQPPYGAQYGWMNYEYIDSDRNRLRAMRSMPVTAQNLQRIEFSPNHVRAWHRTAYQAAGGHDASMALMDDHDLMVRMFLSGAKFVHIPKCLYLYRVHDSNTVKDKEALAIAREASAVKWRETLGGGE